MEISLRALGNGDVGLNATSLPCPLRKVYLKRHLDGKNYLAVENMQVIVEEELVNLLQLEQYVFCIIITYLRSLAFKVSELIQFYEFRRPTRCTSKQSLFVLQVTWQ